MAHRYLNNGKQRFFYGIEMRECSCGVWRSYDDYLKEKFLCYKSGKRPQTTPEAFAALGQSIRNLLFELLRLTPFYGRNSHSMKVISSAIQKIRSRYE